MCQVCVAWFVLYDVVNIVGRHHQPDNTAGMTFDMFTIGVRYVWQVCDVQFTHATF